MNLFVLARVSLFSQFEYAKLVLPIHNYLKLLFIVVIDIDVVKVRIPFKTLPIIRTVVT